MFLVWFCVCLRSEFFTSESEDELSLSNWFGRSSLLCLCKWRLASLKSWCSRGWEAHTQTIVRHQNFGSFFGVKENHGKFGDQHLMFPWFPCLFSCNLGCKLVTRKVQLDTWYGLLRYLMCVFFFVSEGSLYIRNLLTLVFYCFFLSISKLGLLCQYLHAVRFQSKSCAGRRSRVQRSFGSLVTPFKDGLFAHQFIKCQGCILVVFTVYRLKTDVNPWPLEMPICIYCTYIYIYIRIYILYIRIIYTPCRLYIYI